MNTYARISSLFYFVFLSYVCIVLFLHMYLYFLELFNIEKCYVLGSVSSNVVGKICPSWLELVTNPPKSPLLSPSHCLLNGVLR